MSRPKAPEVRTKTQAEKEAEAKARAGYELETEAKEAASQHSASPLDAVSDALWTVVGDTLFQALSSPDFSDRLRRQGLAVAPVCPQVPEAPHDWTQEALDLMGYHGQVVDVLNWTQSLWERAYQAGWTGRAAIDGGGGR